VVNAAGAKAQKEERKPGWSNALSNQEQMRDIMAMMYEGLRQGALGVGIAIGYMTAGVTQYEMFKYQRLAALYGRLSNGHTRFAGVLPPTEGVLGIQEMLCNAMVLDAPFLAAHLNSIQDQGARARASRASPGSYSWSRRVDFVAPGGVPYGSGSSAPTSPARAKSPRGCRDLNP
jgi:hypothetical protein